MIQNPWIMSAIIVLLCLVVLRSRMKRKILEKDIEQLRQQSSAQTPSTPLHLSTVVSQLVAEGRVIPGMENMEFVRRSASKSESSVSITLSHTHTHTHTHIHTRTHSRTHTHARTHSHQNSHTHAHTHAHTKTHTHTYTHTHTHTHTLVYIKLYYVNARILSE